MTYTDAYMVLYRGRVAHFKTSEDALKHASKMELKGYIVKVYQKIILNIGEVYLLMYSTQLN